MELSTDILPLFATTPVVVPSTEAPIRVVVVDDDDCFRGMLSNELTEHGFSVTAFADAQSVLSAIVSVSTADLIILDWTLPRTTGLDLLQHLRRVGITIPVVFLTGRSLISNESLALEHGAIDFIDKSRGINILVQRLRLVTTTKVPGSQRDKVLQFGKLMLKPHVSRAIWNDIDVDLTVGEFKIVNLLARNMGQHVTYREIYDCLHYRGFIAGSGENGYRTNVRSAIKRIRRKFETLDPEFHEIQNYTAFGYIWRREGGAHIF